jgi:hypothetical protein
MTTPTRTQTASPPSPPPDPGGPPDAATRVSRVRVAVIALASVLVVVSLGVGVWAWLLRPPPRDPVVRFTQSIPVDVEAETRAAVAEFVAVFEARRDCAGTAGVELVRDVEGGDARYLDEDAAIEIEIPTTPERFRESLVHELAHHVEHRCPDFEQLRRAWTEHTGTAWSGQERWDERPSEHWAEVVVEMVLGERLLHGDEMRIDPTLVVLASDWIER